MEQATDLALADFGSLLRRFRRAAGLTQDALAERASLGVRTIQDLERGVHRPLNQSLQQLVRALALTGERRSQLEAAARATPRQPHVITLPRRFHPVATETPAALTPRHNLPAPLTSFIGRVAEIAEIEARLRERPDPPRLLTLTGFGGSGKTRLALRVAEEVQGDYPDGVWLVDLSALADPTLVADAVAATLGVPAQSGRLVLSSVVDYLYDRKVLIVLDNCEHLVASCAQLASTVLSRCPSVTILATSRERLGIDGEASWPVPPLAIPPFGDLPAVDELVRYDAVRLFGERARAVRPTFAVTTRNAAAVAQICGRLEGIPLALELAAARVRVLTLEEIARRLDNRFALLTGGSRTGDSRHHTLRATVDWSYSLLDEAERNLLRWLTVFSGGWTLDAAVGVCVGDEIAKAEILELLTSLVDKSLVVADGETAGVERYRQLETLRQFGWERLAASGEATEVQKRHASYFLALVDDCVRQQTSEGPRSSSWDARLETEQANLRAALVWYRDNDPTAGLRLAAGLGWSWVRQHDLAEAEGWLETFLALVPGEASVRGRALLGLATLKRDRGCLDEAQLLFEEALALCRQVDDRWGIARSLVMLAFQARSAADYERAIALAEESLTLARQIRSLLSIKWGLVSLAQFYKLKGDHDRARVLAEEIQRRWPDDHQGLVALGSIAEAAGDYERAENLFQRGLDQQLGHIGWNWWRSLLSRVARKQGDLDRAHHLLEEDLGLARQEGARDRVPWILFDLAELERSADNPTGGRSRLAEGLDLAFRDRNHQYLAQGLLIGARRAFESGTPGRAALLFGAADTALPGFRFGDDDFELGVYEEILGQLRAELAPETFTAAWAEGQALTLEQAISDALADDYVGGALLTPGSR